MATHLYFPVRDCVGCADESQEEAAGCEHLEADHSQAVRRIGRFELADRQPVQTGLQLEFDRRDGA